MNCVYYCFYGGNDLYLKLLTLSLKSLNVFFDKENIFLFSDRDIPELKNFCNIVVVEFPDGYAIPMSYRLILGKKLLEEYDNVLHLDVDTIVVKDIEKIFALSKDNEISFASECEEKSNKNKVIGSYWAGPLLSIEEIEIYKDINSICCGVFLCNKSVCLELDNIYQYVVSVEKNGFVGICRDQHAVTAYVIRNNIYNFNLQKTVTHLAQGMVSQNKYDLNSDLVIYHFAGGVTANNKYDYMKKVFDITSK